jgi:RNA polymerase sigma-70 factor (ECF subfamily)
MPAVIQADFSIRSAATRGAAVSSVNPRAAQFSCIETATDEALIGAIAVGNREAMALLYGRHHVRVYRFVLRVTGDASLAEDIVSEVFLEVWRHAGRFKAQSKASTWLLGIARFKALSSIRKHSHQAQEDQEAATLEDSADNPEAMALRHDRSEILRRCIAHLSPSHREIIDLVYYHDRKIEEVAEIIEVPLNTVKSRMYYARKRISELLQEAGIDRSYQ